MTDECFRLDELGSLLDLHLEDPRRKHLEQCPLCRARLAAYRTFLSEGPPLAGSSPERAEAELGAFIERMIRDGAGTKRGIRARLQAGWRDRRLTRRALIPGLAAAAAAVVLIVSLHRFSGDGRMHEAPLRGVEPASGGELFVRPATNTDGTVTFGWSGVPGADSYEVRILDTSMKEIARFEAARDTTLDVPASEIPPAGGPLLWRVVAFSGGDEISHSRPAIFEPHRR